MQGLSVAVDTHRQHSSEGLAAVLDAARGLTVVVVGDVLLDEYLHGGAARVAREAPVPAVTVTAPKPSPAARATSPPTSPPSARHVEARRASSATTRRAGRLLRARSSEAGVDDPHLVTEPGRRTVVKRRLVAEGQLIARFDEGDRTPPARQAAPSSAGTAHRLLRPPTPSSSPTTATASLGEPVVRALAPARRRGRGVLVVDAHDPAAFAALRPTAVTPSFGEVAPLLPAATRGRRGHGARGRRPGGLQRCCTRRPAPTSSPSRSTATAPSSASATARPTAPGPRPAPHSRACGAGRLLHGRPHAWRSRRAPRPPRPPSSPRPRPPWSPAARARRPAQRRRPARAPLGHHHPVMTAEALAERVAFHKRQGRRIVFTNGCFDLLHRGHVDLLNRAKALGDVLVVGLNTDAGVRALKGPGRPLTTLEDRAQVLAALSCVDHLVAFDEPTAAHLVELLRPDVYVKGGDARARGRARGAAGRGVRRAGPDPPHAAGPLHDGDRRAHPRRTPSTMSDVGDRRRGDGLTMAAHTPTATSRSSTSSSRPATGPRRSPSR